MISASTSAPGKIIVAGEYAVLDGAPAICMAVDRRAYASISTSDREHHTVIAPGFSEVIGRFDASRKKIEWLSGAEPYGLLDAVWAEATPSLPGTVNIVLDSNEFQDHASGTKIGIGSSAALAVALTAALDLACASDLNIQRVAASAHRHFQGGAGSGADIACSVSGGIIAFRTGDAPSRALRWPQGLHYALYWSGVATDTGDRIRKLGDAPDRPSRVELRAAAEGVAHAWQSEHAGDVPDALREYTAALQHFDADHGIGIFDAGHAQLVDAAAGANVIYKPCGAGGGDIGIAISDDAAAIAAFDLQAEGHGFKRLKVEIDARGVRTEGEQQ